jgi:hypothetical protein
MRKNDKKISYHCKEDQQFSIYDWVALKSPILKKRDLFVLAIIDHWI